MTNYTQNGPQKIDRWRHRSFRVDIMLSDKARLQLRNGLSIRTLQNDKAHTNNAAVYVLWIIHSQDFFAESKFFLHPISP